MGSRDKLPCVTCLFSVIVMGCAHLFGLQYIRSAEHAEYYWKLSLDFGKLLLRQCVPIGPIILSFVVSYLELGPIQLDLILL